MKAILIFVTLVSAICTGGIAAVAVSRWVGSVFNRVEIRGCRRSHQRFLARQARTEQAAHGRR